MTKKKDTGIAKVDAKMSTGEIKSFPMQEEIRDILNKLEGRLPGNLGFDPNNATTKELEDNHFSGYRLMSLLIKLNYGAMERFLLHEMPKLLLLILGFLRKCMRKHFTRWEVLLLWNYKHRKNNHLLIRRSYTNGPRTS